MKKLSTLCLALTSLLFAANAQVNGDYRSAGTGDWNVAATWERYNAGSFIPAPTAPDQGDGVIHIRNGHTVTVNTAVTADQIIVDAGGILEQTSDLNLNDGAGDDLTVNGTWNFSSGTIGGPGNAIIAATRTLTFATGSARFIAAPITNNGTMDWQDDGPIYFNAAVTVTNNGAFNISGNSSFVNNAGTGTFINSSTGTVTKSSAGDTYFQMSTSSNAGTININAGILYNNSDFTNTGSITLNNSEWNQQGLSFTNAGPLTFNTGTFNNSGIFNHNTGSVISGTGSFTNVAGATLNLNINQVFSATLLFPSSGNIDGAGNLTINNDFLIEGNIIGAGSLTINANTTTWNYGELGRALTIEVAGTLIFATGNVRYISAPITNDGTMDWQDDGPLYFNAAVTVTNNGTFDISGNGSFQNNADLGTFINAGTVTKSSAGNTYFGMSTLNNSGSINLNGGILQNYATAFTNTGNLTFSTGTFENGGTFNHNTGSVISGTGSFNNLGILNLNIDQVFSATLLFPSSGNIDGAGNLTINNDFLIGGNIIGTGSLTINANTTTWNYGELGRALTIEVAGTLIFATGNVRYISAPITNDGTMDWQDDGPIYFNAAVTVTNNGTFSISGNGSFQNNADLGTFINAGTVTKSSAGTTYFGMSTLNNSGSINLNGGILQNYATAFTNTGNLTFSTGTFENGGTFNHNTGSVISGTGSFNNLGILNLNIDLTIPSTLAFSSNNTIDGAGDLTINSDYIIEGSITGVGSLTINGNGTWNSGTLGRALTNALGSTLTLATAGSKFILADITNNGTMDWQDGELYFNAAVIVTNNGTFDISGNNSFSNNGADGTFINSSTGTVNKISAATTYFGITTVNNIGVINLDDGTLNYSSNFTNTGDLVFNTGTFETQGTFNHNAGSVIDGTGIFNNIGTLNLNIDQVFPSTLVFSNTNTIDGPGDLTINNDFIIEGTITGTGGLTINANSTWNSGTLGRALTNAVGSTLTFATGNARFIAAPITNNGTMNWQDDGPLYFNAAVTVTNNGAFNISGNGSFQNNADVGTFINTGTVTKSSAGTTYFGMGTMTNSTGATIKGVGIMDISTTFNSDGFIAPGLSPGLLTINTAEPLSASSTLNIEMLNGSGPGTGHDLLIRTGDITLAGTLTVTETGTVPDGNYTIINPTGTVFGNFTTPPNLPVGYTLQINATEVVLIKSAPLPLTLISFNAQKTADKKVNLLWVTADEQNVSHFEVQRSADGVNYTKIAIVQALNSLNGGTYSYRDEAPLSKTNHYRLRMVDLDASYKLSPVRMVKFTGNGGVVVFPTVTKDKVYIQTDNKVMVRLFSVSGALLQQKQITDNDFVDLSHLSAGMYLLRIGEEGQSVKIIKQ